MPAAELSFFDLFWQASLLVKLVMLMLLGMSVLSWTLIFQKYRLLTDAQEAARKFEDKFWSGGDLSKLYSELNARTQSQGGMESLFKSGFKEFSRHKQQKRMDTTTVMEGTHRAMRVTLSREVDDLETHLSMLATIGSISPYIGLFGTVWGIMNSFIALGAVQQATLSMVAPGIAEALIATAMGLFAAIPAVIAFNRFSHQVEKLENMYVNFTEEFSNIIHRQAMAYKGD
ncbi:protein TolQ [Algicola sagamiensis]|uniref:protein TolQ n=1 Tax=Algicola sagamiensis TaxID=163869 RepID=UPI00037827D8|nr:protein TolQ [Algicola sagamiensis]